MKQFITPVEIRTFFTTSKSELQKRDVYSAILSGRKHLSEHCPVVTKTIKEDLISLLGNQKLDFEIINVELILDRNQKDTVEEVSLLEQEESFASFTGEIRITVPSHYSDQHVEYLFSELWSDTAPLIEPKPEDTLTKEVLARLSLREKESGFKFVDVWCWDLVDSEIREL